MSPRADDRAHANTRINAKAKRHSRDPANVRLGHNLVHADNWDASTYQAAMKQYHERPHGANANQFKALND